MTRFGLILFASMLMYFSSCRNCTTCTKYPPGETEKICRGDYNSSDSYNAAYRDLQIRGFDCE